MYIYLYIYKYIYIHTNMYIKEFSGFVRLHATAADFSHELINRESGIEDETDKILQNE